MKVKSINNQASIKVKSINNQASIKVIYTITKSINNFKWINKFPEKKFDLILKTIINKENKNIF